MASNTRSGEEASQGAAEGELSPLARMMVESARVAFREGSYAEALEHLLAIGSIEAHPEIAVALAVTALDVIAALNLDGRARDVRLGLVSKADTVAGALESVLAREAMLGLLGKVRGLEAGSPSPGGDAGASELVERIGRIVFNPARSPVSPVMLDEQDAWGHPVPVRVVEGAVALTLFAAGLFFASHAAFLDFGRMGLPGPAFFPFVVGSALSLVALGLLIETWWEGDAHGVVFFGHRKLVITMVALLVAGLAFGHVDSYLLLGTFVAVLMLFVERAAPWRVALNASLGMIAVWVVLEQGMGVRLPVAAFWGEIAQFVAERPLLAPL
jgi:hypothetical protein